MPGGAFLGLGATGAPMASHLSKSPFELTVWTRTRSKADDFAKEFGGSTADTPSQAVRGAEIVFTCLPSSREVGDVLAGADGILAGLSNDATLVDCTSRDPPAFREVAAPME